MSNGRREFSGPIKTYQPRASWHFTIDSWSLVLLYIVVSHSSEWSCVAPDEQAGIFRVLLSLTKVFVSTGKRESNKAKITCSCDKWRKLLVLCCVSAADITLSQSWQPLRNKLPLKETAKALWQLTYMRCSQSTLDVYWEPFNGRFTLTREQDKCCEFT